MKLVVLTRPKSSDKQHIVRVTGLQLKMNHFFIALIVFVNGCLFAELAAGKFSFKKLFTFAENGISNLEIENIEIINHFTLLNNMK